MTLWSWWYPPSRILVVFGESLAWGGWVDGKGCAGDLWDVGSIYHTVDL